LLRVPQGFSPTERVKGTEGTARGAGKADLRSKIHQSGNDRSWFFLPVKILKPALKEVPVLVRVLYSEAPGKDTADIAVYHRNLLVEGKNKNRPGGVLPHPGEGLKIPKIEGNLPAKRLDHHLGSPLEVQSPPVISEPPPEIEKLLILDRGADPGRREGRDDLGIAGEDRFYPGLLEQELAYQDLPGRDRFSPPRESSSFFRKPGTESFSFR
jgi:hypothetical protein